MASATATISRQLVSQQDSSLIKRPDVPRSQFINRYGLKTAFDAGKLIPIEVMEVLPGDHIKFNINAHVRLDTPYFPLMDSQRIDVHMFYEPSRVVWPDFTKMLGEQEDPTDDISTYSVPIVNDLPANGPVVGSLFDYLGVPTVGQIEAGQGTNLELNAMIPRIYNHTWNEWFRSQDLQNSVANHRDAGPDSYNDYTILPRNKSHDFFTMALPQPQKGTAVSMEVAGLAPVIGIGYAAASTASASGSNYVETGGGSSAYAFIRNTTSNPIYFNSTAATNAQPMIYADLSAVSGVSINTFRQAMMVQTLLEQSARGGTRYVEQMMAIWGVRPPDFRVQRPEYIGGGSFNLIITPVASTDGTTDPLGTLGAAGTANGSVQGSYAATEHGYIIILMSVKTELSYQQGLHQMWSRRTRYDFPVPAFAGLGEEAVLRREIYCTGNPTNDEAVWGYVPRYERYRTEVSKVTGIMRSTAAGTLDQWHFAQDFGSAPTLGDTFIRDTPDMARVLAAAEQTTGQQYKADIVFNRTTTRPLPAWGIPATLGRL